MCFFYVSNGRVTLKKEQLTMTDIIHGRPRTLPVDNPFFRWWQSVDQWTLLATLGLIVVGLLLSMAASVPLADSNDMQHGYYLE